MNGQAPCEEHLRCYELVDFTRVINAYWGSRGGALVIIQDTLKVRCNACRAIELHPHPPILAHVETTPLTLRQHLSTWWHTRPQGSLKVGRRKLGVERCGGSR